MQTSVLMDIGKMIIVEFLYALPVLQLKVDALNAILVMVKRVLDVQGMDFYTE